MKSPDHESSPGIWSSRYRWTTVGTNALIFLGAFEALAVTTIMPTVSRDLDGEALYAVAFSGALAASVVGMVVAGGWADRRGPSAPLITASVVFLAGLIVAGTASTMGVFLAGRVLQGLGSGAIGVAIYVLVGRLYEPVLHPRIFGAFAAAWVLPSLVGPPVAGLVADGVGWQWVFLGVAVLVIAAAGLVVPALLRLRSIDESAETVTKPMRGSVLWAIVVAVGILGISLGGESAGALSIPLVVLCLAVVVVAIRPLLPRGTLLAHRGLPAAVLLRVAVAAAFYATEIYLPYLLNDRYGLPSWLSGLVLTVAAISWAVGSQVQSRLGSRMTHAALLRIGTGVLAVGIAIELITAWLLLPPWVAAIGWLLAGAGMGLMFPRMSTLALERSTISTQGFNSAAMSIADATGGATAIAISGLLFASVATPWAFVAALGVTTVVALLAVPASVRVSERGR